MRDTFTISLRKGELVMHSETYDTSIMGAKERAQGQYDFIKHVAKDMHDFDAVFSIHECVCAGARSPRRSGRQPDADARAHTLVPGRPPSTARRRSSSATAT